MTYSQSLQKTNDFQSSPKDAYLKIHNEWIVEGIAENKVQVAKNLIAIGLRDEQIRYATDLTSS